MKRPPRTLTDVRNELVRTRANIKALYNDSVFSDKDRDILVPRYKALLKKLEEEEKLFKTMVQDIKTFTA